MENNTQETLIDKLKRFAKQQNFQERLTGEFRQVWKEAGIINIQEADVSDMRKVLAVLSRSEASTEFIKAFCANAVTEGLPENCLDTLLESDIDHDGRSLAQEIFRDNTNPFVPDKAKKISNYKFQSSQSQQWEY
jgi:hypothetical protein